MVGDMPALFPLTFPHSSAVVICILTEGFADIYQGEEWKALRKRFNPGFAPQHLLSLLPAIVHKASIFVDRLSDFSKSGDECSLQRLATDLTFDVIGDLALDTDMVGHGRRALVTDWRSLTSTRGPRPHTRPR